MDWKLAEQLGPRGLCSVAQSPVGGNLLMVYHRSWYWRQSFLTFLLMTWMMEQSDPKHIYRWYKTERSGWYTRELCWHPEGPGQARELGSEEPCEVQQGRNNFMQHICSGTTNQKALQKMIFFFLNDVSYVAGS